MGILCFQPSIVISFFLLQMKPECKEIHSSFCRAVDTSDATNHLEGYRYHSLLPPRKIPKSTPFNKLPFCGKSTFYFYFEQNDVKKWPIFISNYKRIHLIAHPLCRYDSYRWEKHVSWRKIFSTQDSNQQPPPPRFEVNSPHSIFHILYLKSLMCPLCFCCWYC